MMIGQIWRVRGGTHEYRQLRAAVLGVVCLCAVIGCSRRDSPTLSPGSTGTRANAISFKKAAHFWHWSGKWSIAFSPDGSRIAYSSPQDDHVDVVNWHSRVGISRSLGLGRTGASLGGIRFSPDGRFIAAMHVPSSEDEVIRIWAADSGARVGDIQDAGTMASSATAAGFEFLDGGRSLAWVRWVIPVHQQQGVMADSFVAVADTLSQKELWVASTEPVKAETLWLSRDGRMMAVAGWTRVVQNGIPYVQPRIILLNLASKTTFGMFDVLDQGFRIDAVAWSADGKRIAVGGYPVLDNPPRLEGPTVQVWNLESHERLNEFSYKNHTHLRGLLSDPSDRCMVVAWYDKVQILTADGSELLQAIPVEPLAIALSPDGRHLAIAENSGAIGVWNVRDAH